MYGCYLLEDRLSACLRLVMLCMAAGLLFAPAKAMGADLVTGSYLQSKGERIVVEIRVGAPAPSTVILTQHFPMGVRLEAADPSPDMYHPESSKAKWLLKGIRPGSLRVAATLSRSLRRGEVRGELQYRDPVTSKMVKIRIGD